jgi:hypothetical protein
MRNLLLAGAVLAASVVAPAAAQAATATPKCVIEVTRHFTKPPADHMYIKVSHPCTSESARVLATCYHYVNGKAVGKAERGKWTAKMGTHSTISCHLGAYGNERWQRKVGGHVYTTKF